MNPRKALVIKKVFGPLLNIQDREIKAPVLLTTASGGRTLTMLDDVPDGYWFVYRNGRIASKKARRGWYVFPTNEVYRKALDIIWLHRKLIGAAERVGPH